MNKRSQQKNQQRTNDRLIKERWKQMPEVTENRSLWREVRSENRGGMPRLKIDATEP